MVDKPLFLVYTVFSDRVADTCEACDQGSLCGGSFFIGGKRNAEALFIVWRTNHISGNDEKTDDSGYCVCRSNAETYWIFYPDWWI